MRWHYLCHEECKRLVLNSCCAVLTLARLCTRASRKCEDTNMSSQHIVQLVNSRGENAEACANLAVNLY